MTRCAAKDKRAGLTLLELLVVIVLMALVTATVTVRIGGRLPQAALTDAVHQIEFADSQLRLRARRAGRPVALHIEVGGNILACSLDPEHDDVRTIRRLPRGVRIARLLSFAEEVSHGPATIRYSEQGATETLVIELAGSGERRRWIFVAGLTGQTSELASEREARELLERLAPPGIHAG